MGSLTSENDDRFENYTKSLRLLFFADMAVGNATLPCQLLESDHWGYYKQGQGHYSTPESLSDFEALTEPLDISASNGIDSILESVRSHVGYFQLGKGSCANSSDEYLDRHREHSTCFSTCHTPSTLFLPFNLEPCMKLATIAVLVGNGTLQVETTESDATNGGALESLGIGDLTTWDGNKILSDVVQCVVSSCDDTSIGTCPPSVRGLRDITVNAENLQDIAQSLDQFCDGVDAKLNPDIAGPGTSISLFLFLILKTLNSWSRIFFWPLISLIGKIFVPRRPSAWAGATVLQDRLAQTRLNAATITSLVEFQEVQAFFVISIGIATLATFQMEGSTSSGSNSFAEVLLNAQMVQSLAVNSILPVVLTQCVLQREGMLWWYSFALTSATVLLAQIVRPPSMSRVSSFDTLWQNFKEASPVEACGGLPNPMTYCKTDIYNGSYGDWRGTGVALGFVYIAIATLLIDMLATVPRIQQLVNLHLSRVRLRANSHELRGFVFMVMKNYICPCLREFWWFGVQAGLLALVISYFTEVLIMAFSVDLMHFRNFNYGQLIAVMVWAPTLGKFVYFSICEYYWIPATSQMQILGMLRNRLTRAQVGIEEGFGRRLAKNYRVVRDVYERESHDREYGIRHYDYEHGFGSTQKGEQSQVSVSTMSTAELKTSEPLVPHLAGPKACYRQITSLPRQA